MVSAVQWVLLVDRAAIWFCASVQPVGAVGVLAGGDDGERLRAERGEGLRLGEHVAELGLLVAHVAGSAGAGREGPDLRRGRRVQCGGCRRRDEMQRAEAGQGGPHGSSRRITAYLRGKSGKAVYWCGLEESSSTIPATCSGYRAAYVIARVPPEE